MDTEQQKHKKLLTTLRIKGAPAQVDPLATPNVLIIADADGNRPRWLALEHHYDLKVIKLVISRDPEALFSVVGADRVWQWFQRLPIKKRLCNHDEILNLLWDCYTAHKAHRFPRLIKLCGTSYALEALVAAHSEDDLSL